MKNRAQFTEQRNQAKVPDWLYQEAQEDDFLMGKTPQNYPDIWEDEE